MEQMESLFSPFSWGYAYQEEGMGDLSHSLSFTTIEPESTLVSALEELGKRDSELVHLKDLLSRTEKERDELQESCKKLRERNLILQQQLEHRNQQETTINNIDDEPNHSNYITKESITNLPPCSSSPIPNKALPEKGKLLQAVVEAGPLLQTILGAGPLPKWHHPPPQLSTAEIPPVAAIYSAAPNAFHQDSYSGANIKSCVNSKRNLVGCDGYDYYSSSKHQKFALY